MVGGKVRAVVAAMVVSTLTPSRYRSARRAKGRMGKEGGSGGTYRSDQ